MKTDNSSFVLFQLDKPKSIPAEPLINEFGSKCGLNSVPDIGYDNRHRSLNNLIKNERLE